eukprot:NODE_216_length_3372_cov_10.598151.p1 GENE.NODE_216_length_3372_cov_10.598151~~NODE_216_length_3372_cov_10.598151.p1  ORF type:complete len:975 (+),score=322.43 NODE_216_length_3372_cov_10.598151:133-3057(+)
MAVVAAAPVYAPPPRLTHMDAGGVATPSPTDLCYGVRVGIRSCTEQRYIAAHANGGGYDVDVSGYHPFRAVESGAAAGDAGDRRALDCPSEWLLLHYHDRQYRGAITLGDYVVFAKECPGGSRRGRCAYLALGPMAEDNAMVPIIEHIEASPQGTDLCRWKLQHAENPDSNSRLLASTPVLIHGKYHECLALGQLLAEVADTAGDFMSPSRLSGRALGLRSAESRGAELRFRIVKAGIPFGPDPSQHPPALTVPPPELRMEADNFCSLHVRDQEQALLEDVLFCFLGVEGVHIRKVAKPSPSPKQGRVSPLPEVLFEIDVPSGADISIVQFLRQVMPVCNHHGAVWQFVEVQGQHEYGMVNHALCAAMRNLLAEFSVGVGQLESALVSGELTIAKLWYHIQPSMDTLALLHRVASHVYGCLGGHVLNGIEEVMSRSSLATAQDLCEFLLQQASRPYFEMVSRWIYEGRLDDPYGEFFVSEVSRARGDERSGGPGADFWHKHFTLEVHSVPRFLSSSCEKILHAGKYLNVFFSAVPHAELPEPASRGFFRYSRRRRDYAEPIDAAYRRASQALLGLFMKPQREGGLDLQGRLKSMRSFFFLGKADWFGQLMDTATAELEQPANAVPLARLEGLLDVALRGSSVASDTYREEITCALHCFSIEDACKRMSRSQGEEAVDEDSLTASVGRQASRAGDGDAAGAPATLSGGGPVPGMGIGTASDTSGIRCFTLKYRVSWPLAIVFSNALLLKYQVIFRHLLYCRYVERKLVEVWVDHQYTKDLGLDMSFSPSYSLRQRMLHFCRDYIYYATIEVLEPQSHQFFSSLERAETIDEVLGNHALFLDACLRELLLTEREHLYRQLSKVLITCLTFAYNLRRFSHNFHDTQALDEHASVQAPCSAERRLERVRQSTQTYLSLLSEKYYSKMISKFKVMFESQLQGFLRQIRQESKSRYEHFLSNMLTRLDYNEYYSSVFASS